MLSLRIIRERLFSLLRRPRQQEHHTHTRAAVPVAVQPKIEIDAIKDEDARRLARAPAALRPPSAAAAPQQQPERPLRSLPRNLTQAARKRAADALAAYGEVLRGAVYEAIWTRQLRGNRGVAVVTLVGSSLAGSGLTIGDCHALMPAAADEDAGAERPTADQVEQRHPFSELQRELQEQGIALIDAREDWMHASDADVAGPIRLVLYFP